MDFKNIILQVFPIVMNIINYLCTFLCSSKEKYEKKRRTEKSLFPRSLRIFRELQNSRAFCPLKQLQFFFRKTLAHTGLFNGYMAPDEQVFMIFDTSK